MAGGCACEVIARLDHIREVAPGVGSGVPRNRAGADGEVDVTAGKYPSAVVSSGCRRGAACRQIGDCGIIPRIGVGIVAIRFGRECVAAGAIDIVAKSHRHEAVISDRVVRSHGPHICGNVVNLNVKIRTDSTARNAINLAVEVSTGMEICRDGIGWQASVIGVADRVVPPKCGCGVEVLVFATKQIDIGAVGCTAEPGTRFRQWSDRRPGVGRGTVFVRVCDGGVVNDATEAINIATY